MAQRGRPRGFDRSAALHRALEVFWRHGYEGTSLQELTSATRLSATSLYAAFGSKEDLFREAVALYNATEGQSAERALRTEPTARRAVEAMLRSYARSYTDTATPLGCMVVLAATTGPPRSQPVRDFLAEVRRSATQAVRERLERGTREGDLPPDTDTASLAAFYSAVLHGLSLQARDGATHEDLTGVVDCAMAVFGVLPHHATNPGPVS